MPRAKTDRPATPSPADAAVHVHDAAIIGAGFGGVGAACRLKREGFGDLAILEQGDAAGGCWRENTYPGVACDVPSALYSYSFAPKTDWSREFAGGAEIQRYVADVARREGLTPSIRYGTKVTGATWNASLQRWDVETNQGPLSARVLVSAAGPLHEPLIPDLPGLSSFPGAVFHSARWDHTVDLKGKRVVVVGSGASAIQFVPEIAKESGQLTVFQRTAPWLLPRLDAVYPGWVKAAHRFPPVRLAHRAAIFGIAEGLGVAQRNPRYIGFVRRLAEGHLRRQVADPAMRERFTPDYDPGCKRILFANSWYPALQRPNVEVASTGVAEIRGNTVIGQDGTEHEADVLVLATGFHVTDPPIATAVRGEDGRTLAESWNGSMRAYYGTTVSGFPNLFLLIGPSSGLGHSSLVFVIEQQVRYAAKALAHMRAAGLGSIDVTPEAQAAFVAKVDERLGKAVWSTGGCGSYYLDSHGRNATIWPWSLPRMRTMLGRFDVEHYRTAPVLARATAR